jgi:hypothetical protein
MPSGDVRDNDSPAYATEGIDTNNTEMMDTKDFDIMALPSLD